MLHPKALSWIPTGELEHPSLVKMEGHVKNPLGRYYLYYAPHKHEGIGVVYSDSIEGPWTEYEGNPVVEGAAAPDVRWVEANGEFRLWAHRNNSSTECWSSDDGLHFEYQGVSITARTISTRNASYSRTYAYPLERYGSKYIMLYSGVIEEKALRCIWLAYSKDADNWTQVKTPLVEPVEGENHGVYGPSLLQWAGRTFIVYQDHIGWRGGNIKYVEIDRELNPVGDGGKRFTLMDPPPEFAERYRGGEFCHKGDTLYLVSGASKAPRIFVYATAKAALPANSKKEGEQE